MSGIRSGVITAAVALALVVAASPVAAQVGVTLYAGYVASDGIENVTTDEQADIKSSAAYAIALSTVWDAGRELQLFYSQQSTTLSPGGGAAPFDLTIRYLHIGGTVYADGTIGRGLYGVGGVGATQFSPGSSGYGSEVKPSLNVGLGYAWPLAERVTLTAEARVFITLVNSSGGFLCSGGCVAVLRSDALVQGEAMLGLNARF
jgi:hypothetical protein